MLSSPPFPRLSVGLSPSASLALFRFLLSSHLHFFPLPVGISHHSISSSLCFFLSFHLQSTHLYSVFCFYSCLFLALHLFLPFHSCLGVLFLLCKNQSVHTLVSTDLLPPTHTHTRTRAHTHTHCPTHIKTTAIQKICSRTVYNAPGFICECSFAGWPH